jgi:hypothetical protein
VVDFKRIGKREVVTKKLKVTVEIELNDSLLTPEEACDKIRFAVENQNGFSEAIVMFLRETRSSTWELCNVEVTKVE